MSTRSRSLQVASSACRLLIVQAGPVTVRSEARQEAEQRSNDRCPSSRRSFGEKHGYFILWSTVSEDGDSNIDTLSHNICARFSLHGCTPMCPCPCVADLVADRCARAGAKAAGSRSTRRTYRPRPSAAHRSGLANWSPHPPPATDCHASAGMPRRRRRPLSTDVGGGVGSTGGAVADCGRLLAAGDEVREGPTRTLVLLCARPDR